MTDARKKVVLRVALLAGCVLLLAWFFLWKTGRTFQYEVVQEDILYRCSARSGEEFAASAMKVYPLGMIVTGTPEQLDGEALTTAANYGHKNKARVALFRIDEAPTAEQVQRFATYVANPRRQPVLLVDSDGLRGGMLTAAYRLEVMKMPLAEVKKLAQLPDSPPEIVERVRKFADDYAAGIASPASGPAPAVQQAAPVVPQGPPLPE